MTTKRIADWFELLVVALLVLYFFLRFAEKWPQDGWLVAVAIILFLLLLMKVARLMLGYLLPPRR
jgi:hypothetical protein